jgi:hypothetical protein
VFRLHAKGNLLAIVILLLTVLACSQGTMYVVMNFGVFVCSPCAGIHREINHKVKGISMSNFSEAELQNLTENGNLVSLSSNLPVQSNSCL